MSRSSTVRCVACGEAISEDTRVCPHCGELQPTPLIAMGMAVAGVFMILLGLPLGAFSFGLSRWIGFAMTLVGMGLAFGGYTSYLDAQRARRTRSR